MNQQRPGRPVGVLLSAIALGLAALLLFLLGLGGVSTTLSGAARLPGSAPGLPAGFMAAVMVGMTLLYFGLAAWAVGTLVGLLRMRSWARISSIVIAACMAGFGLLFAIAMLGVGAAMRSGSFPLPPTVNAASMHKMLAAMAFLSLVMAGAGVAALVYFAQRSVRAAFARAKAVKDAPAAGYAAPYSAQAIPVASPVRPVAPLVPAPDPLTDFTVARPLVSPTLAPPSSPEPELGPPPSPPHEAYPPPQQPWLGPQQTSAQGASWAGDRAAPPLAAAPVRSGRPVSITVLAIFALISAFFSLFSIVSSVPVFLFGAVVSGWPVHLYSLVWASAMAIAGLGMLRLQRPAWMLSFGLLGVSALHFLVLLLPGPRGRYIRYMADLQKGTPFGMPQTAMPGVLSMAIALSVFFGLVFVALFAVVLWRARWAFPPAAVPPAAPADEQNAG